MTTIATAKSIDQPAIVNGVNVDRVINVIDNIEADAAFAKMQFRLKNRWIGGGLNRSSIKDFYGGLEEDKTRTEAFTLDADEPNILAGDDSAPNPVEYVLHALAGCLTTSMVYHAAVRGIEIEAISSELEGDLDLRGLFGLSQQVRKGYHDVRVKIRVKSGASAEELKELALFSPVYDIVSNSLPVELVVEKF
jgi:uncharacterized OsmC-like protein